MPVRSDMEGVNDFVLTMVRPFVLQSVWNPARTCIWFYFLRILFLAVSINFILLTAIRNNFPRIKSSIIGNVAHVTFKKDDLFSNGMNDCLWESREQEKPYTCKNLLFMSNNTGAFFSIVNNTLVIGCNCNKGQRLRKKLFCLFMSS